MTILDDIVRMDFMSKHRSWSYMVRIIIRQRSIVVDWMIGHLYIMLVIRDIRILLNCCCSILPMWMLWLNLVAMLYILLHYVDMLKLLRYYVYTKSIGMLLILKETLLYILQQKVDTKRSSYIFWVLAVCWERTGINWPRLTIVVMRVWRKYSNRMGLKRMEIMKYSKKTKLTSCNEHWLDRITSQLTTLCL